MAREAGVAMTAAGVDWRSPPDRRFQQRHSSRRLRIIRVNNDGEGDLEGQRL
jgi:hypothetical protein